MSTDRELVYWPGVLFGDELNPAGHPEEDARTALKLALFYARNLTKTSSGDAAYLALMSAAKEAGVPEDRAAELLLPMIKKAGTIYPPGFM